MFCKNCGHQLPDDAIICASCGATTDNYRRPEVPKQQNLLAVVGFVLSFFVSLAGLICSAIALKRSDRDYDGDGKGMAVAGTVISSVALVVKIITIVVIAVFFAVYVAKLIASGILIGEFAQQPTLLTSAF